MPTHTQSLDVDAKQETIERLTRLCADVQLVCDWGRDSFERGLR